MKKMKRLAALFLAVVMVMAMGMTAMAATITIENPAPGETYSVYKVFNVSIAADATEEKGYTYYLDSNATEAYIKVLTDAGVELKLSADGTRYTVMNAATINAAGLASDLAKNISVLGTAVETKENTGDGVSFTNLPEGYYFVDSTLGSLCALNTNGTTVDMYEKNSIPSIEKFVKENEADDYAESADADITQDVYFQLKVNTGTVKTEATVGNETGVDGNYTITDVIPDGLTFKNNVAIADFEKDTDYTVSYVGTTLTIVLLESGKLGTLNQDEDIYITYSATVNDGATIGTAGNVNNVTLTYKDQTSTDSATVKTYAIGANDGDGKGTITKIDATNNDAALADVGFTLTNADGNRASVTGVKFAGWKEEGKEGYDTAKILTDENGEIHVEGLDAGTYTLTETDPKVGYNALDYTITVKIDENGNVTYTENKEGGKTDSPSIIIANSTGAILPSTGGIGTTIFYVVGGILVLGAGVLLITKKRMSARN